MSSTYSTSLKLELIGNGDQSGTWGTTTNNNLGTLLEQAITGVQSITMSNADYTLSNYNGTSDEARNAVLVASGTNSAIRKIVAPQGQNKLYTIFNNTTGGYAITIGAPTGTAVTIPSGVTATVFTNGSDFYSAQTGSAGNFTVNGTLTATGLTDTGNMSIGGTLAVTGATTFTGIPSGPTAAAGTNTTQLATTAFALANGLPSGAIVLWSGSIASIPSGWYLCNGSNGTPNLQDRFVVGAGSTYAVGVTGGSADAIIVTHTHTATSTVTDPGHQHTLDMNNGDNGSFTLPTDALNASKQTTTTTQTATTGITVATSNATAGVSGSGANMPPYYALAFIMKS
jgi:hypothetical protein